MNMIEETAYDLRGLMFCTKCEVFGAHRLLREWAPFLYQHHNGLGLMSLRDRRPDWLKTAQWRN
jgi:hypothetical protein